jgi:hypothetical protein
MPLLLSDALGREEDNDSSYKIDDPQYSIDKCSVDRYRIVMAWASARTGPTSSAGTTAGMLAASCRRRHACRPPQSRSTAPHVFASDASHAPTIIDMVKTANTRYSRPLGPGSGRTSSASSYPVIGIRRDC